MYTIKSWLKTEKENVEIKEIVYINLHLKDGLGTEFTAYYGGMMPEGALTEF